MRTAATAFAPCHITGFFEILDEASDPARMGSRGAGFSVAAGVESRVTVDDETMPGVTVTEAGRPFEAATTRRAVELLAGAQPMHFAVEQRAGLPVSQGFGVSAAGALSAALAVAEALGRPRHEALWAAHCAEVLQRTGLGDAVGADRGGFEMRVKPGCPPYGDVRAWHPEAPVADVALAVVAPAVLTKRVLTDPRRRADVNRLGRGLVDAFVEEPSLARFVDSSRRFAIEAHLATEDVVRAWDAVGPRHLAAQAQLGGSVFVFNPSADAMRRLAEFGPVHRTRIDAQGARVVEARRGL